MEILTIPVVQVLIEIALFIALTLVGSFVVKAVSKIDHRVFNLEEYLPKDEIHTLIQVAYLALMSACFINVMYTLIYVNVDTVYFAVADVTLSLFIAATIDKSTLSRKLIILLLVPYGALSFLLFNNPLIGLLDFVHVLIFICFIKHYYDRFMEYTESNGLGITIILMFTIIFVSFIVTTIVEAENPLNAISMVSNAFTSNGYAVLGNSDAGKINNLVLVWLGFIISGAGTATLTAAIIKRQFNSKLKDYDDRFDGLDNKLEDLENLIKKNSDD